jgi:hypothetical protein
MKIIKNIFVGLGVLFVLFLILAAFLSGSSAEFKADYQDFVIQYTKEFSRNWEIKSVSSKTTNGMLSQISTPNGKAAVNFFRSLGEIVEVSDVELNSYRSNFNGPSVGVFKFKAKFKNGDGLVTVIVHKNQGTVKVHGLHILPIGDVLQSGEFEA